MSMTRKDFQLIVETMHDVSRYLNKGQNAVLKLAFSDKLQDTYPNFDSRLFWNAIDKLEKEDAA